MSVLSNDPHTWIRLLVLFVAAGTLGFLAGFAAQQRATAGETPFPSDLGPYTYETNTCSAGAEIDPINVVFTNHGFASEITQQAIDHGDWEEQGGAQYLRDQEGCFQSEGSPASTCCLARWHMRHYNHKGPTGGMRTVANWGSISSASAHHEDFVLCGHAVDDMSESFTIAGRTVDGGFNAGREDIRKNWVVNSDHVLEMTYYWDNRKVMEQCDHDPPFEYGLAWSDGDVYYIRTFDATTDYDGDGCTNEAELQIITGSETSGGRRDPANPWDFYDTNGDAVIDLFNDIMGVINRFGLGVGDEGYDPVYDRGPSVGPYAWNMTAPDGVIDLLNDIVGVINQFGHDCTA